MRQDARRAQIAALVAPQLGTTEELLGTGTVWAARLTRVPLVFRGRHRHPLALTDTRVLLFDTQRPRRQRPDPLLALRLPRLEVVRSRRRIRLYQLILGADQDRRFVLEFPRRDRTLARELEAQIVAARQEAT
jgi:hypothetical protein